MFENVEQLWTAHRAGIRRVVTSRVADHNDAADLMQDVFLKLHRHFDKVRRASNVRSYVHRLAANVVTDHYRTDNRRNEPSAVYSDFSDNEPSFTAAFAVCCLRKYLNQLPADQRDALLRTELGNESQKELATRLGLSHSGAKSRVQRAKKHLRQLILNCCPYESDRYGNLWLPDENA